MPTSKPRIAVAIDPAQYETLRALATLQNRSMSSIVAELIDATHPVFERLVSVLTHARSEEESVHKKWRELAEEAEHSLRPQVNNAQREFMTFLDQVESASADPRPVTRGSGRHDLSTPEQVEGGDSREV